MEEKPDIGKKPGSRALRKPGHAIRKPRPVDYGGNRAEDGYPLGLGKPVSALTDSEAEAVARRHKLWTRRKMRLFLQALAQTCSVSQAAKAVGMSRQSAYRLRSRMVDTPFDAAWEVALEFGLQQLSHAALDRALNGVKEPVFQGGKKVGTRTRFDERLTMFLLSNPGKVGRSPIARDFGSRRWDSLLDYVERGPLRWDEADIPDAGTPEGDAFHDGIDRFVRLETHYPPDPSPADSSDMGDPRYMTPAKWAARWGK